MIHIYFFKILQPLNQIVDTCLSSHFFRKEMGGFKRMLLFRCYCLIVSAAALFILIRQSTLGLFTKNPNVTRITNNYIGRNSHNERNALENKEPMNMTNKPRMYHMRDGIVADEFQYGSSSLLECHCLPNKLKSWSKPWSIFYMYTFTGHLGKPSTVDTTTLTLMQKERFDRLYREYGFNVYVSDLIGTNRILPPVSEPQ